MKNDSRAFVNESPPEERKFVQKYGDIIYRIHQIMEEKGLTRSALADKLGKKPSEISRWLKGEHNLTLKTLTKLEVELGEDIIIVPSGLHFESEIQRDFPITVKRQTRNYANLGFVEWKISNRLSIKNRKNEFLLY